MYSGYCGQLRFVTSYLQVKNFNSNNGPYSSDFHTWTRRIPRIKLQESYKWYLTWIISSPIPTTLGKHSSLELVCFARWWLVWDPTHEPLQPICLTTYVSAAQVNNPNVGSPRETTLRISLNRGTFILG